MGNICAKGNKKSSEKAGSTKRVICIGGGHCNCQVVKILHRFNKQDPALKMKLTLISEQEFSFYSGMLPGTVSGLYTEEQLRIELAPLAAWCEADFVHQRVKKISGKENKVYLEDGGVLPYDVLVVNVGSKTKDTKAVKGVWEYALTTRPINSMLGKIKAKEQELLENNIIPKVAICGAGAAGTELSFAFKKRWSDLFKQDIDVTLISADSTPLKTETEVTKQQVLHQLNNRGIDVVTNARVEEVQQDRVVLMDGREIECNVAVWATGADPQEVSVNSDLELLKGFFRVNKYMQSVSYPNILAGGDCAQMEDYINQAYPTKAGVYAVRQGPVIAENVAKIIKKEPLTEYVPQQGFLSLMMTGDGKCIGSRNGLSFYGDWVWALKDYIDQSFMNLFEARYLFKDFEKHGTKYPLPNFALFEDATEEEKALIKKARDQVDSMDALQAAKHLAATTDGDKNFQCRWQILQRMTREEKFREEVVKMHAEHQLFKLET